MTPTRTAESDVLFYILWNRGWGIIDGLLAYHFWRERDFVVLTIFLAMVAVLSVWQGRRAARRVLWG